MKACGKGTVRVIFGIKALFCDEGCAESFGCDRRCGLFYPTYRDTETEVVYNSEEASVHFEHCCYCTTFLGEVDEDN